MRKILELIKNQGFQVGDRLPSERELAQNFSVSRNMLREALKVLQTLGILKIKQGSGIFVRQVEFNPRDNVALWLNAYGTVISDILIVREALEMKAIELIPKSIFMDIQNLLKQSVIQQEQSENDMQRLLELDLEFHNIIRKSSGNELLYNICADITDLGILEDRRAVYLDQNRAALSISEHRAIVNAFSSMDVDQIKTACRSHFTSVRLYVINTVSCR
jgi:GntR family transcriptional repressor for pyruvate dehydrogenase complex